MSVKINCYCCGNPFTIQDDGLPDRACRCAGWKLAGVGHCAGCLKCDWHCRCEDRPLQHKGSYLEAWKLWALRHAPAVLADYLATQERRKKEYIGEV